jgi:hypothetical protein
LCRYEWGKVPPAAVLSALSVAYEVPLLELHAVLEEDMKTWSTTPALRIAGGGTEKRSRARCRNARSNRPTTSEVKDRTPSETVVS